MKKIFKNKIWYLMPMLLVFIYVRPVDAIMFDSCNGLCNILFIAISFLFPLGMIALPCLLALILFKIFTSEDKFAYVGYLFRTLLFCIIFYWLFYIFYLK